MNKKSVAKIVPIGNGEESWDIICFSDSDYEGDQIQPWLYNLLFRSTSVLAIKVTVKHYSAKIRGQIGDTLRDCENGHV